MLFNAYITQAVLESGTGVQATKERGLKVIRTEVRKSSKLVGKTALECNFRERFKAAIVAYQRGGKSGQSQSLSAIKFMVGDILILQANDDSPFLVLPPEDFEKSLKLKRTRSGSGSSLSEMLRNISNGELNLLGLKKSNDDDSLSKKAENYSLKIKTSCVNNTKAISKNIDIRRRHYMTNVN